MKGRVDETEGSRLQGSVLGKKETREGPEDGHDPRGPGRGRDRGNKRVIATQTRRREWDHHRSKKRGLYRDRATCQRLRSLKLEEAARYFETRRKAYKKSVLLENGSGESRRRPNPRKGEPQTPESPLRDASIDRRTVWTIDIKVREKRNCDITVKDILIILYTVGSNRVQKRASMSAGWANKKREEVVTRGEVRI